MTSLDFEKALSTYFIPKKDTQQENLCYSEIHGFDPSNISIGPIFHLPITVIVPENEVGNSIHKQIVVQPPAMYKLILNPYKNSKKCSVKLVNTESAKVEIETIFETSEYSNEERNTFIPSGSIHEWRADIKCKDIFEIYVYQKLTLKKGFKLTADLEVHFC